MKQFFEKLYLQKRQLIISFNFTIAFIFSSFILFVHFSENGVNGQMVENEVIENTLKTIEKLNSVNLSEIKTDNTIETGTTENAIESIDNNGTFPTFQEIENMATTMDNSIEVTEQEKMKPVSDEMLEYAEKNIICLKEILQ